MALPFTHFKHLKIQKIPNICSIYMIIFAIVISSHAVHYQYMYLLSLLQPGTFLFSISMLLIFYVRRVYWSGRKYIL